MLCVHPMLLDSFPRIISGFEVLIETDTHLLATPAAMAQRKGELLKLETLERLASLYADLHEEAALANH